MAYRFSRAEFFLPCSGLMVSVPGLSEVVGLLCMCARSETRTAPSMTCDMNSTSILNRSLGSQGTLPCAGFLKSI